MHCRDWEKGKFGDAPRPSARVNIRTRGGKKEKGLGSVTKIQSEGHNAKGGMRIISRREKLLEKKRSRKRNTPKSLVGGNIAPIMTFEIRAKSEEKHGPTSTERMSSNLRGKEKPPITRGKVIVRMEERLSKSSARPSCTVNFLPFRFMP